MNAIAKQLTDRIKAILQKDLDTTCNIYIYLAKKGFAEVELIKSTFGLDDQEVQKHLDRLLLDKFIIEQEFDVEDTKSTTGNGSSKKSKADEPKQVHKMYRVRNFSEYKWDMDLKEYFG